MAGEKVIAMGYRTALRRDTTIEELTVYFGVFCGYEPYTGYPVFDSAERIESGWASWAYDSLPTREEAVAMMVEADGR